MNTVGWDQLNSLLDQKFQLLFQALNTTTQQIQTTIQSEVGSIGNLIKTRVLNEGVRLGKDVYYQRVIHNPLLHKILFIIRYVISTKDGVVVTWPFKVKDNQYVFVTNIALLKFAAKTLFPKDLGQKDVDDVIVELNRCQIETYVFEDEDMHVLRTLFPLESNKKQSAWDKKNKWFGIRAELLRDLFATLHEDYMKRSTFTKRLKTWMSKGQATGRSTTEFPDWKLTKRSRSQIYPTKSDALIPHKIQWGVEVPLEFLSEDVYKAIKLLEIQQSVPRFVHIGCGWVGLTHEPITRLKYNRFYPAAESLPKSHPAKSGPRKKRVRKNAENGDEVSQPPVSEPLVSQLPVSEPPVSQLPVSEPPVSQLPVSEPPVSEPLVSQLPVSPPHIRSNAVPDTTSAEHAIDFVMATPHFSAEEMEDAINQFL